MATGQFDKQYIGFGNCSKSLGRAPRVINTRFKPIGSFGHDKTIVVYGDEATLDFIDSLYVPWGENEPSSYDSLQQGFSYVWNIGKKTLTISNENGEVTVVRKINTITDLCIDVNIFESHQFIFFIDAFFEPEAFLIATRLMSNRNSQYMLYSWGEFDKYLRALFHASYSRLYKWLSSSAEAELDGANEVYSYGAFDEVRTFINALILDLTQSGQFDMNLLSGSKELSSNRKEVIQKAVLLEIGQNLMIYAISISILSASNKYCYEPWMLWTIFKWIGEGSNSNINRNKIFDLSPNWG